MDIVWEHARTIVGPLRQRNVEGGVETELQSRVLQLRKKRELEREREKLLKDRAEIHQNREKLLQQHREAIAAKKEALRKKLEEKQRLAAAAAKAGRGNDSPNAIPAAEPAPPSP